VATDWVAERWGIGSTRLHLDLWQLALAVLLFDRVVLPTPSTETEADRWDRLGWDTETQAKRAVQLGELVYFAPWEKSLHVEMRDRWRRLGLEVRELGYWLTPKIIAEKAWNDVTASAEAGRVRVKPIPVAWYGSDTAAAEELRLRVMVDDDPVDPRPTEPYEQIAALQFSRVLKHPLTEDPESAFEIAYKLSTDPGFRASRRALFQWEAEVAAARRAPAEAAEQLEELVTSYNKIVTTYADATVRRVVHSVVPRALGVAARHVPVPGLSAVTEWSARNVMATLAPLPPKPDPEVSPGASLVLAQHAMSALYVAG
jgi:hypothetical protein